ncbi:MAG: hypothetical protein J6N72_07805, partial [Psychrobacter sp.]|nr:hypothetical protein [Psychrobacter sp.]
MSDSHNFRKNSVDFIEGNLFILVKLVMLISVAMVFFLIQKQPSDPMVFQIQRTVALFGLVAAILYPTLLCYFRHIESENAGHIILFYVGKAVFGTTVCAIILCLIGEYGVAFKDWVALNTSDAYVGGVSLILIWLIIKLTYSADYSYDDRFSLGKNREYTYAKIRNNTSVIAINNKPLIPSDEDIQQTAAHEAGHVFIYAAFGCLPPHIEVAIKNGDNGSLGYTRTFTRGHELYEKTFAEWRMLVLLAGKLGQSFVFGENTVGSESDHRKWMFLAINYLSNHFDGIFYIDPQ